MGSDTNIISASAIALADSFEYAIWKRAWVGPTRQPLPRRGAPR